MNAFRQEKVFKVVFIGDSAVGKTSIVMRFYRNVFHEESDSTVGSNYVTKTILVDNKEITMNIWDTAGQERFRAIVPMYTRGSHAAVVVFNIHDEDSFRNLDKWIDLINRNESFNCKIYIAANKIDLGKTPILDEAIEWAKQKKYVLFLISAKDQQSIINMFQHIAEDLSRAEGYKYRQATNVMEAKNVQPKCC